MTEGKEGLDVSGMNEEEKIKLGEETMTPGQKEMSETREKLKVQGYESRFNSHLDLMERLARESESEDDRKYYSEVLKMGNTAKEAAQNREEILLKRIDSGEGSVFWHRLDREDRGEEYRGTLFMFGYLARTFSDNEMGIRRTREGIYVVRLELMEPGENIDIY